MMYPYYTAPGPASGNCQYIT